MQTKTLALAVACCAILTGALSSSSAQAQGNVTFGGGASTSTGVQGAGSSTVAAPAAAAAEPGVEALTPEQQEWAERDRQLNEPTVLSGGVGLLHTQHAQSGAPGQFRLSFMTEYFSAGFLCTSEYPCQDPRGPGKITSDSLDHIGGHLSMTASLTKWMEIYLGTGAFANSDAQNRPSLLQVLGDSVLGAKVMGPLSKVFHVGGAMELWLINGTGAVGLDGSGTSAKFRGLATADLRGTEGKVPLRFSLNGTYSLDNTGDVIAPTEAARGTSVTRIERFGLAVNRVDHFDINLGGEYFAAQEKVRPFIEYQIMIPVNRQGYLCRQNNISGDGCLAIDAVAPSKLTLGGRFFPWKQGFGLTAALDIGVTGVGTFIEEVAPTAPWTLFIGAGWGFDTWDRPPVEKVKMIEKVVQVKPPVRGHIKGFVHEADKTEGIASAIVAWENHPELTALATGADGRFVTQPLDPGPYAFAVKAEGYKPASCTTEVAKNGQDVQIDCPLPALPRVGTVIGHVRDADTQAPIANASIKMVDSAKKELTGGPDAQGTFRFELVTPGPAEVTADAEGYLTLVMPVDVKMRQENNVDVPLKKRPKTANVTVGKGEITIKQQIMFAVDSATILPESYGLLNEIADALIKNPRIKRVEVQGHTDNSGTPERNKVLSEDRASAVAQWLTAHGVAADRLTARGYGQTKPLAPNVTAANKARNRRVQFIIIDQDAATAPPKKQKNPVNLP